MIQQIIQTHYGYTIISNTRMASWQYRTLNYFMKISHTTFPDVGVSCNIVYYNVYKTISYIAVAKVNIAYHHPQSSIVHDIDYVFVRLFE